MKRLLLTILLIVTPVSPTFAIMGVGDIVYDPATHSSIAAFEASQLVQWATAIKRYEDMILGQRDMLRGQSALIARVGDWQGVYDRAKSIQFEAENFNKRFGKRYNVLAFVDYGQSGLGYTNRGQYAEIVTRTRYGTKVHIEDTDLKRYVAIDNLHDDVVDSYEQTDRKIEEIKKEIARCAEEIARAKDQAETEKSLAKLQGLKIVLDDLRADRNERIARLMATKAVNDSQGDKERRVKSTVTNTEHTETMQRFGTVKTGGSNF